MPRNHKMVRRHLGRQVRVGGVANQVQHQVDDPSAGEDLAVVGAWIWGELSERHGVLEQGELPGERHAIRLSRTCVR